MEKQIPLKKRRKININTVHKNPIQINMINELRSNISKINQMNQNTLGLKREI